MWNNSKQLVLAVALFAWTDGASLVGGGTRALGAPAVPLLRRKITINSMGGNVIVELDSIPLDEQVFDAIQAELNKVILKKHGWFKAKLFLAGDGGGTSQLQNAKDIVDASRNVDVAKPIILNATADNTPVERLWMEALFAQRNEDAPYVLQANVYKESTSPEQYRICLVAALPEFGDKTGDKVFASKIDEVYAQITKDRDTRFASAYTDFCTIFNKLLKHGCIELTDWTQNLGGRRLPELDIKDTFSCSAFDYSPPWSKEVQDICRENNKLIKDQLRTRLAKDGINDDTIEKITPRIEALLSNLANFGLTGLRLENWKENLSERGVNVDRLFAEPATQKLDSSLFVVTPKIKPLAGRSSGRFVIEERNDSSRIPTRTIVQAESYTLKLWIPIQKGAG